MRSAHAVVAVAGGSPVTCYPGDLIGRLAISRLRLEDPSVSEVHALVSAREDRLWLLYLRKPVSFEGRTCWHLPLSSGSRLPLTPQLELHVHSVWLGGERLVASVDGGPGVVLAHTKYGLAEQGLVEETGPFVLWSSGDAFFVRDDAGVHELEPGDVRWVQGRKLEITLSSPEGTSWTELPQIELPLTTISTRPGYCLLEDERGTRAELTGQRADVFYSLARRDGRASWLEVARDLWGRRAEEQRDNLRNNVLWRLDRCLRSHGLRDDLILRTEGHLYFADRVNFSAE